MTSQHSGSALSAPVWTQLYPDRVDIDLDVPWESVAHAWNARVAAVPAQTAVLYRGRAMTTTEIDTDAEALATGLVDLGCRAGTIVGIYLQNVPQFAIALLAAWKIGAVPLVLNPMYRGRELRALIDDSGAAGLLCDASDAEAVTTTLSGSSVSWVLTTTDDEYAQATVDENAAATGAEVTPQAGAQSTPTAEPATATVTEAAIAAIAWADLLDRHRPASAGSAANPATASANSTADSPEHRADLLPGLDDPALLTYTSGTTGPAKGSVATHWNVLSVALGYGQWLGLDDGDVMLAVAPLFHITGAVACAATSLVFPVALDFIGRPDAESIVSAVRDDGVTVTIGSITVFNALLEHPSAAAADFASVRYLYSGGAPVPPATVERFRERFGHYIHNIYGMTETASAVIGVPPDTAAPVDPATDTLAIGVPFPGLSARVVDVATGAVITDGTAGELELRGPQVTPGYLHNPEANARAFDDGWLRTGDVAVIDDAGWIYLVDRIKDQINVSGYKVWPREVEDVLYEHPAVLEAAVVGQPDDYRGETVVAFVSLRAGETTTPADLIAFAKERLAAYKYPRRVHIIGDLPKTHTGKIQRRLLRDSGTEAAPPPDTTADPAGSAGPADPPTSTAAPSTPTTEETS
ncbi:MULTISPECIES: class I adenylate-forming enzyme family protein [Brevibacterium]|uniref:AMP-binding protein n=1 Tax=Brevibacterium casei TaxID=33889 RepID=A0A7T4A154_9MICO|nr:AMP-binding protein [Brevibacterium casei]QQB15357.1 AMP-binding protein [Brevibacterium casei]